MSLCNSACPSGTTGCKPVTPHPGTPPPPPARLAPFPLSTSLPPLACSPSSLPPWPASLAPPGPPRSFFNVIVIIPFVQAASSTSRATTWDANVPRPPRDDAAGRASTAPRAPHPPPPTPTPLSFHRLPFPLPPAPARRRHGSRPSTGRLCRAGPGRAGFSALFAS